MKVLSYLEWMLSKGNYSEDLYIKLLNNDCWSNTDIAEFYSQQFKPELITELFEGWKTFNQYVYIEKPFRIIFTGEDYFITNTETKQQYIYENPRTLDDFINDCQRAGIELNWRTK